jgi:F-type H+-transporting ATPase subunit a
MDLSPDARVILELGPVAVNATLLFSWSVMALLVVGARVVTRRLAVLRTPTRGQTILEAVVATIRREIAEATEQDPAPYLPFIATLYLFVATANLLAFVPGYEPPTASLSTTAALAGCVFFAVPILGIRKAGVVGFFRHYVSPTPLMLPFHVLSEISRTVAMAVRLFGNVMSGTVLAGILLSIVPFFVPVPVHLLELLIGQVQAYIIAVLATVYIASGLEAQNRRQSHDPDDGRRSSSSGKGDN